ncbi:MAG: hypothetical protein HUJ65_01510, partial [Oscillospiraceae bacterium]|nr:hypothetical protein [Oscillospiraceae bacterium]
PVDMFPGAVENAHERYMIIMGGDTTNILELGGKVEIDIGSQKGELFTFAFDEAVAVHVEEGLFYNVRITEVADPAKPIFFNHTAFGVYGNADEKGVRSELCGKKAEKADFEKCFQTKDTIWARFHPHHEVVYPSITILSPMFGGKTQLRRSWMAVSDPFAMEIKSHYHEFNQYLTFCGTDPDNMADLGGTIEFTIGETPDALEKYTCDKACQFFVKEELYHSPLIFASVKDIKKPILFCETSLTDNYGRSAEIGDTDEKSEFELFAEKMKAEHEGK